MVKQYSSRNPLLWSAYNANSKIFSTADSEVRNQKRFYCTPKIIHVYPLHLTVYKSEKYNHFISGESPCYTQV